MILFLSTSSRIDSIRASQRLVNYMIVLLIIKVKGQVTDHRPSDQVLQLADILGSRTFGALGYIKADPITLSQ
jgi:hypothetical protein